MLAIVQFPIADGRLFSGIGRQAKPVWSKLAERKDFVRRFGAARMQADFEAVPSVWADDAQYVNARWAIRARGRLEERSFAGTGIAPPPRGQPFYVYRPKIAATEFCFAPAFRRLLSDGAGAARVDVGFWVFGGKSVGGKDVVGLIHDLLAIETEVTDLNGGAQRRPLAEQGKPLANLYFQSTSLKPPDGSRWPPKPGVVQESVSAVFVDDRMSIPQMPRKPTWFQAMAAHLQTPLLESFPSRATVVPDNVTGNLRVAYTTVDARDARHAVWMIRGADGAQASSAPSVPGLRQCLLRLHAMRQVLTELVRLAASNQIPPDGPEGESDKLTPYLQSVANQVLRPTHFGADQAALREIVSLYDLGRSSPETAILEAAYDRLPQDRQLKARMRKATVSVAGSSVITYQAETIIVNTGPTTNITQSGSNNTIAIHELNQVAGDYIRKSKEIAATAQDDKLKSALDELRKQVEALAKQTPDPQAQETAARKLKQITEEAASSKPDSDLLKVTGKGLIDAAKTVAQMVGPVTTAVTGVLSILGLAL